MKKVLLAVWMVVLTVFSFQQVAASDSITETWKGTLKGIDGKNEEAEANYRYEILNEGDYITVRGQIAIKDAKQKIERFVLYYRCNKQQKICALATSDLSKIDAKHGNLSGAITSNFIPNFMNNPGVVMSPLFDAATASALALASAHLMETMQPSVYAPERTSLSGDVLLKEIEKANNMLPDRYGSIYYYSLYIFVASDELAKAMQEDVIKNRSIIVSEMLAPRKRFIESKGLSLIVESFKMPSFGRRLLSGIRTSGSSYDVVDKIKTFFPPVEDVIVKITKGLSDSDVQNDLKFLARRDITVDTEIETTCGNGTIKEFSEKLKKKAYKTAIKKGSLWKAAGGGVLREVETCVDKVSSKYARKIAEAYSDMECNTGDLYCLKTKLSEYYWKFVEEYAKVVYQVIPEEKASAKCALVSQELKIDGNTVISRDKSTETVCD